MDELFDGIDEFSEQYDSNAQLTQDVGTTDADIDLGSIIVTPDPQEKTSDTNTDTGLFAGIDEFESSYDNRKSELDIRAEKLNRIYDQKEKSYTSQLSTLDDVNPDNKEIIRQKLLDGLAQLELDRLNALGTISANIEKDRKTKERTEAVLDSPRGLKRAETNVKLTASGMMRLTTGIQKTITDALGLDATEVNKNIAENEKYIKDTLASLGYEEGSIFNPADLGQIAAEFAIPAGMLKRVWQASLLGGTTAGLSEVGSGETYTEALKVGALTAAIGISAGTVIDIIGSKGANGAIEYLWDKHSPELIKASGLPSTATKEEVLSKVTSEWSALTGAKGTNKDTVKAIIDRMGSTGGAYKKAVQEVLEIAEEKTVRTKKFGVVEKLGEEFTQGADFTNAAKELIKQVGDSKKNRGEIARIFNSFSKAAGDKYPEKISLDSNLVGSIKSSLETRATLSKGLSSAETNILESIKPNMSVSELLNMQKDINKLIDGSTGKALNNANILKSKVRRALSKAMDPADYKMMLKMNQEYSRRMSFVGKGEVNKIGLQLLNAVKKNKTFAAMEKDLAKLNLGEDSFRQLEKTIGSERVAELEQGIIKKLLDGGVDELDYKRISDAVGDMGFVSKEGKEFKEAIKNISEVFSADSFTILKKGISEGGELDATALTANLVTKMKYSTSSFIWRNIKKMLDTTKGGIESRQLNTIAKILKNNDYTTGINVKGLNISNEEIRSISVDAIQRGFKDHISQMNIDAKAKEKLIEEVDAQAVQGYGFLKTGGKPTKAKDYTRTDRTLMEGLSPASRKSIIDAENKVIELEEAQRKARLGMGTGGTPTSSKTPMAGESGGKLQPQIDKAIADLEAAKKKAGLSLSTPRKTTGGKAKYDENSGLNQFLDKWVNPKETVDVDEMQKWYKMVYNDGALAGKWDKSKQKLRTDLMSTMEELMAKGNVSPKLGKKFRDMFKKYAIVAAAGTAGASASFVPAVAPSANATEADIMKTQAQVNAFVDGKDGDETKRMVKAYNLMGGRAANNPKNVTKKLDKLPELKKGQDPLEYSLLNTLGFKETDGNFREAFKKSTNQDPVGKRNAWCAKYLNFMLTSAGVDLSKTASAKEIEQNPAYAYSYRNIGKTVFDYAKGKTYAGDDSKIEAGMVVIFSNGYKSKSGKTQSRRSKSGEMFKTNGHAAIVVGYDKKAGTITVLGGNQDSEINVTTYFIDKKIGGFRVLDVDGMPKPDKNTVEALKLFAKKGGSTT